MSAVLYFAYGSNLNRDDWRRWCGENGHSPDALEYRSIGYLPDYDVRFSYRSRTREGGVLDVQPRIGQIVPGVIYQVNDGWRALGEKEGAAYEPISVTVLDDHGQEIRLKTYRVREQKREPFVKPNANYLSIVLEGLELHDLPRRGVEAAADNQSEAPLVDAFFVYGTLMRREGRFEVLRRYDVRCALLAKTFGRLIDLGAYPALIDLGATEYMVHGEFVRVAAPAEAISQLDEIEGFQGFGEKGSLYRRTLCEVDVGEARIRRAWTYCWAAEGATHVQITSGDWRQHRGVRDAFLAELAQVHAQGDERKVAMGIANGVPFNFKPDATAVSQSLLPLKAALAAEEVSERLLAQQSGIWAALA